MLTKSAIVRVVSYPGDLYVGVVGEVISINRLNGDSGPAELFLLREHGEEDNEDSYLAVNEDEVVVVYTADERCRLQQMAKRAENIGMAALISALGEDNG